MADIEIEIDGKKLSAKPNQMVIEVADAAGIYIPRFCYHKHLSIAANCRMCLVEVEKSPKALPACATPVMPGMKVFTQSAKTIEAQRAVMEFLLINHPLDCPICDQGGECELQDLAMGYGSSASHYDECKRSVEDEDLGPLIATEMTRCILCTRCVRFGDEVAGIRELGVTNRGGHAEISTYVQHAIQSEVSGNIIDICPVGALTSKPYRFTARAWELAQSPSISPHDCLGSNLNVHTLTGAVKRVVARENAAINETWLSDRDRFGYAGLDHPDRLGEPLVRRDGKWHVVEWQKALEVAASSLHEVVSEHGADKLGALASPNATLEEFYLLQKLMRALGSPHVDHRLREKDTRDQKAFPLYPGLGVPLTELEACDAVLLIGSNLQKEQPLAALRVRKAVKHHAAKVLALNPMDYQFHFDVAAKIVVAPHHMVEALSELVQALERKTDHPLARHLADKRKISIIVGALAQHHPDASVLRAYAQKIATLTGGKLSLMTDGANAAGAWLAGMVPHRHAAGDAVNHVGLNANEMLDKPRKAYLLLNVEPDRDCADSAQAMEAMKQAKCVIAFSMYRNPVLEAHAHVIFPIAPFTETSGTFVNAQGDWQAFSGVATAFESSRPAWKVLRVLANFLHLDGFDYESSEEVKKELMQLLEKQNAKPGVYHSESGQIESGAAPAESLAGKNKLSRIGEIPLYAVDGLVRRSMPLQEAQAVMEGDVSALRIHGDTAKQIGLSNGGMALVSQGMHEISLPVMIDGRVPKEAVWIAGGIAATAELGDLFGDVKVRAI